MYRALGMGGRLKRKPTETSSFGVGKRESHDSSAFYERFTPPDISSSEDIRPQLVIDEIFKGDAAELMADEACVADNSVALVITSPPYFVGKAYEEAMGEGHVPSDYADHLDRLQMVFSMCKDKLEPGGRIAVNVANLGRRPYRSQAADILRIFEDLGLLVRGEIIWQKSVGLSGSTAWGSFQSAANPVLRDTSERIIVASKGRFDRAKSRKVRAESGLPSTSTISREAFMAYTTDVWQIPSESAKRVGHPAPFPVALPRRLIELYTYEGDLVLDPYMGSGTTAVAALKSGRTYIGFETEPEYVEAAERRIEAERLHSEAAHDRLAVQNVVLRAGGDTEGGSGLSVAVRQGRKAEDLAVLVLEESGFTVIDQNSKVANGVSVDIVASAPDGSVWHFDVTGAFTNEPGGLRRIETMWTSLGKAAVMSTAAQEHEIRLILLTTDLPSTGPGRKALRAARGNVILDAVEMLSESGRERLVAYAEAGDGVTGPIGDLLEAQERFD